MTDSFRGLFAQQRQESSQPAQLGPARAVFQSFLVHGLGGLRTVPGERWARNESLGPVAYLTVLLAVLRMLSPRVRESDGKSLVNPLKPDPARATSTGGSVLSRGSGWLDERRTSLAEWAWMMQPPTAMRDALPVVCLARHGQTAWTVSHQHTGVTDLPLTAEGEAEAVRLGDWIEGRTFASVFTSPLRRAVRTCELAGYGRVAVVEPDLTEWNYGAYEGRTTGEIHAERPSWDLFRDGCPGGEMPEAVGARADRVIRRVRAIGGDVLLFSSGHFLRVFAARWLGLEPRAGKYFVLGTASLSELGYEHDRSEPVIRLWDQMHDDRRAYRGNGRERGVT